VPKLSGISHDRAVRAFLKAGFWVAHEGKHSILTDGERILTIPRANPIHSYTMAGIVKDSGLTVAEFKKLL
jgi:predicted RNA binding protein YcfA (HicA-like mRNA interferase family)